MTNDGSSETPKFFEILAMLGPATFLEELVPRETADDQYLQFNDQNSREFLILRILIEVQKTGTVLGRWRKFADDADLDHPREKLGNYERQTLEAYIDEQSLWQRKLTESLVLLINFTATNTSEYYYHFLLVHELERIRRRSQELRDFFSISTDAIQDNRSQIESKLSRVESSLGDLASCWYLNQPKTHKRRSASFSRQLHSALAIATTRERRALGYTYAKGFGEARLCLKTAIPWFA